LSVLFLMKEHLFRAHCLSGNGTCLRVHTHTHKTPLVKDTPEEAISHLYRSELHRQGLHEMMMHWQIAMTWTVSSPKNENYVINYSPSCCSKPVRLWFILGAWMKVCPSIDSYTTTTFKPKKGSKDIIKDSSSLNSVFWSKNDHFICKILISNSGSHERHDAWVFHWPDSRHLVCECMLEIKMLVLLHKIEVKLLESHGLLESHVFLKMDESLLGLKRHEDEWHNFHFWVNTSIC